jgi:microcystin-dependent protein
MAQNENGPEAGKKVPLLHRLGYDALVAVVAALAGAVAMWAATNLLNFVKASDIAAALKSDEAAATELGRGVAQAALENEGLRSKFLATLKGDDSFRGAKGEKGEPGESDLPIGTVVAWPSDAPLPSKRWMICNGGEAPYSGSDDPIFLALGTRYGQAANTATHVKLPDFQGMFLRGLGSQGDAHVSRTIGEMQVDAIARHRHSGLGISRHPSGRLASTGTKAATSPHDATGDNTDNLTGMHSGGKPETRPVNYAVQWIIRVK